VTADGEETIRDEACWRLELTRNRNLATYSRIRAWITKGQFRPWKFEYYGNTGALLKVAHYHEYRDGPLGVRSMRIDVENRARPGETTTMTFTNLRPFDTTPFLFDREGMLRFRDAALAIRESTGAHARPEQLHDRLSSAER